MHRARAAVLASLLLALAGCGKYGLPSGATDQAHVLHMNWSVFFYVGVFVAVVVIALILAPPIIWRRRAEELPAQFSGNTPLEIGYTVVPLLMVIALFGLTFRNEDVVQRIVPKPANTVDVVAFQWSWRFRYPATKIEITGAPGAPPQMVLPLGVTTRINLTSTDVNHAFWVPAFLFKRDAIAGFSNHFDLRPTRVGSYRGECAEFCGLDHARMSFTVRVTSQAQFDRWLNSGGSNAVLSTKEKPL